MEHPGEAELLDDELMTGLGSRTDARDAPQAAPRPRTRPNWRRAVKRTADQSPSGCCSIAPDDASSPIFTAETAKRS